jgi:hypothetical protein
MPFKEEAFRQRKQRDIDRRRFMYGIGALSISSAFYCDSPTSIAATADLGPGGLLVDAHCHPFNGRDLPIFGVLQKIIIEQQLADYPPLEGLAEPFAFF